MKLFSTSWGLYVYQLLPFLGGLLLSGCEKTPVISPGDEGKPPIIVTTTTMVTDLVKQVGGDLFEIRPLMKAGVDPHSYKPTAEDVDKITKAKIVIYGGLHLEGHLVEIFERLNPAEKIIVSLGDSLPVKARIPVSGLLYDPHIWGDAKLWAQTVPVLVATLVKASPAHKEDLERRGRETQKHLMELHSWLKSKAELLTPEQRVLVTSHDAFQYFGRAYGFEVIGVQGISTDSEAGVKDIARVIDLVRERKVKAIFIESTVSPAVIQRIAKDSEVAIGGELFSDALGIPGTMVDVGDAMKVDQGTLEGMLKSNMTTIINALKP